MEEKLPEEIGFEPEAEELTDSDLDQVSGGTIRAKGGGNSQLSNSELNMIGLQSVVSQRATAIQLTTGMMNSINDGEKKVAKNIGR